MWCPRAVAVFAGGLQAGSAHRQLARSLGCAPSTVTRLLDTLLALSAPERPLHLLGDGHPAYGAAVRAHPQGERIRLERHPNPRRGPRGAPRSAESIAREWAMFPTDALHALLRHSLAHHRRETIAFGRRLNALLERLYLAAVWRNFVKGRSERRSDRTTPAMRVGLADEPWKWRRVLSRRLFPGRETVPGVWRELYRRDWTTPVLHSNARHRLRYAY